MSNYKVLAEGIAAARAGDHEDAQRLLRRATQLEPDNVEAWIWRASVMENRADKKPFLEKALRLDPDNIEAKLALERIMQLEGDISVRVEDEETHYCTVHPDRETMLRCNRCGRLMCTSCAVRHPVGLRCRECVNEMRSPIYKVDMNTTLKALLATLVVATPIGLLVLTLGNFVLGFGIFGIFIAFMLGGAIGRTISETVQRMIPRKRGRPVQIAVGMGIFLGLLIAGAGLFLVTGLGPSILLVLLYLGTAISSAVTSLR